jgi:aldose 1-epimerase
VITIETGRASAAVAAEDGGRLASLVVDGAELLVTRGADDDPMLWGAYPMVPYAGRVRDGRFTYDGRTVELPLSLPPNAGHGLVWNRPWTRTDDGGDATRAALAIELGPDWPFGGGVEQQFHLTDDELHCTLTVVASDRSMPAEVGWHPWFASRGPIDVRATAMYERVGNLPTGRLVAPGPPPWDDCFLTTDEISFPIGALTVSVRSDCDHVVLFDEMDRGIAVEPQSGPPDAFHLRPRVLAPHERLSRTMTIAWRTRSHTDR